eukprot:TRINITY_DN5552_c0_g1_i1.p1 TRINITY_DN5552_c0_g1~~TRINITY_DN5552_c0_g1_i1.p1  ORF type:complete len:938 (-),score=168.17 TRINITY_DN5552_c0_g1_i1:17-2830(-)
MRPLHFVAVLLSFVLVNSVWYNPVANPKAVVTVGNARFTVLTDRLIRMEYSQSAVFQDAATWAFLNRNLPVPSFTVSHKDNWVLITTDFVELAYLSNVSESFNAKNLYTNIRFNAQNVQWKPAHYTDDPGNLLGTVRTLDGVSGSLDLQCVNQSRGDLHCTYGIISRTGYVVYDDTHAPYFNNADWPWLVNRTYPVPDPLGPTCAVSDADRRDCGWPGISSDQCLMKGCCMNNAVNGIPTCYYSTTNDQDLYLFGYGHDYKTALRDFTRISGSIPVPPRYAFGIFYSRYWAYNDVGMMELVNQYQERDIPLDNLVTDMDWHITFYKEAAQGKKDQAGETIGWTGFTWDSHLFPNPQAFLDWCKARGLRNTLNLHPASGMQPWEEKYAVMATAMGIDPSSNIYVPFNITDTKFTNNWSELVLAPLEKSGIDYWWLDWQQGEDWIHEPLVNPTFWLNYVFFTNPSHWQNNLRPMLLHRWGGLGNHRYQIGFSGDVVPTWDSLAFQPYFTATASNVLYSYWSHDIGGHTQPSPPELYTRWIQWGIFSPIFRTHCTKNADNDRRIWMYPPANYVIMRDALKLRAAMVPYIYTYARIAHESGIGLLRPMYYEWPEDDEAYTFDHQYYFGDDIIVSPVVAAVDTNSQLASKSIWLPQGNWVEWFSGQLFKGPAVISPNYALDEIPVFVRAGSIIPLRMDDIPSLGQAQVIPTGLQLNVFLGGAQTGRGSVYEDDGTTTLYEQSQFAWTNFEFTASEHSIEFVIHPTQGKFAGQPTARSYDIMLRGSWPATGVTVNDVALPFAANTDLPVTQNCYTYSGDTLAVIVHIVTPISIDDRIRVEVQVSGSTSDPLLTSGYSATLNRFITAKETLDNQWGIDTVYQEDYFDLLIAAETGRRITDAPATAANELSAFAATVLKGIDEVKALAVQSAVKQQLVAQLGSRV